MPQHGVLLAEAGHGDILVTNAEAVAIEPGDAQSADSDFEPASTTLRSDAGLGTAVAITLRGQSSRRWLPRVTWLASP